MAGGWADNSADCSQNTVNCRSWTRVPNTRREDDLSLCCHSHRIMKHTLILYAAGLRHKDRNSLQSCKVVDVDGERK